jgi:DNA modification methylase
MQNNFEVFEYLKSEEISPLFLVGDSFEILQKIEANSVDCIITSPPYWGQRNYSSGGIGNEESLKEFIFKLSIITKELFRILKPSGSFWLNLGDTYNNKALQAVPWRVAITIIDEQRWILRNSVIWNKQKGGLHSGKDRLGNVHENFFHFVKNEKNYFYDSNAIRSKPRESKIKNGVIISATGVSGIRYKRQIELSTSLSEIEKLNASEKLNIVLDKLGRGEISDFRMIIRNQQRATHSDSITLSGRARELAEKGFYFLFYNPNGSLPNDVWEIIPEDSHNREKHFASFPEDLCKIPILATCPKNGIVLDPFCGTGTTNKVAYDFKRKSIGIDLAAEYIEIAQNRIGINEKLEIS